MKIIYVLFILFLASNNLYACCCEGIIKAKTEELDKNLETTNKNNLDALKKFTENVKENNEIVKNRIEEIKDNELKQNIDSVKINNAKNLYHALNIPEGILYYSAKKDEKEKKILIENLKINLDYNLLESKTNMQQLQNNIILNEKKFSENRESETKRINGE